MTGTSEIQEAIDADQGGGRAASRAQPGIR